MDPTSFTTNAPGRLVPTVDGHRAFVPAPLPPSIEFAPELVDRLAYAAAAVGLLAGTARNISNPLLLIAPYLRREAVLSSRIEGTVSTLADLYEDEAIGPMNIGDDKDVREVRNYLDAHEHGLERLEDLPLSLRLLREVHEKLMQGVRGEGRHPGEFRSYQNWIAPTARAPIAEATYVPPPVPEMIEALNELERFLHSEAFHPLLIAGLAHYQFEAIHPFGDGNGRVGRLMISLFLHERRLMPQPLLNLSAYLERTRLEYYERLMRVSTHGDWSGWLLYFLDGVGTEAEAAVKDAERLLDLQTTYHLRLGSTRTAAHQLIDQLFINPVVNTNRAVRVLGVTAPTARAAIAELVRQEILIEVSGRKWGRRFLAQEILDVVEPGTGGP